MRNFNSYQTQFSDEQYSDEDSLSDSEQQQQFYTPQQNGNYFYTEAENSKRHPKKRKLESFKSSSSQNPTIWTEQDTFILLETWGEKYLELNRRSLRSDDWAEVTERVNEMIGIDREETEYRSQLDLLKNKYRKERLKVESGVGTSWVFYKNMDVLLNVRVRGGNMLGCGIDSGEYCFMDSRVYLERGNVLDEMRDSPVESEEEEEEGDEGNDESSGNGGNGEAVRVLTESVKRFAEVYAKMEESKMKQMVELERMREEFQRELDVQKKDIVDRAQAEIARIREMDCDEEEGETDNSVDELGD